MMRDLLIDTSKHAFEKKVGAWDTSVSTPYSSASTMSTSFPNDCSSDRGSDDVSPGPDIKKEPESESSPPFYSFQDSSSPPLFPPQRRKPFGIKEHSPGEDQRKKSTNERSKTGCITCRKRKKKCDETKPYCNNCTKTNYSCEGYPPLKTWNSSTRRGSRQRSDEDGSEAGQTLVLPPQQRLPTFPAVENDDDQLLLNHYITKTSQILSMNDSEDGNPWTELILPMAKDDQALMHAVLALAGSHLTRGTEDQRLNDRQMFHVDAMLSGLRRRIINSEPGGPDAEPIMASMILQFLMSKNDVTKYGTPQACLKLARQLLQPPETPFWRFAWAFCKYHEFSTTFTSLPGSDPRPNFELSGVTSFTGEQPHTNGGVRQNFNILVGMVDVPFMTLLSKITSLRDQVRRRQALGNTPVVHYSMLVIADELGRDIAQWQSGQQEGTSRYVAAELYRRAAMLYLLRTVRAASSPESRKAFATCVQQGLECLRVLPPNDSVQSGLLLPIFILGCGAFEPQHRSDLGHALDTIETYSGFGNVKPVRDILQRVWSAMDAGDVERSWDWETVTQEMGYEALLT